MTLPRSLASLARATNRSASRAPNAGLIFGTARRQYAASAEAAAESIDESPSENPSTKSRPHLDDYYALLLEQPLMSSAAKERFIHASELQDIPVSAPASDKSALEKARIIFGSKLVGPAMRQKYIEDLPSLQAKGQGTYIAGVWIPPRPAEPDNCCMAGCVNCVWDGYRDELEEWVRRKRSAQALAAEKGGQAEAGVATMGDDDGMGSSEMGLENAMSEIPVGIREFMKLEKRLRQQRATAVA